MARFPTYLITRAARFTLFSPRSYSSLWTKLLISIKDLTCYIRKNNLCTASRWTDTRKIYGKRSHFTWKLVTRLLKWRVFPLVYFHARRAPRSHFSLWIKLSVSVKDLTCYFHKNNLYTTSRWKDVWFSCKQCMETKLVLFIVILKIVSADIFRSCNLRIFFLYSRPISCRFTLKGPTLWLQKQFIHNFKMKGRMILFIVMCELTFFRRA